MHPTSNLIVIDWIMAGRISRNEIWEFESFVSNTSVTMEDDSGKSSMIYR